MAAILQNQMLEETDGASSAAAWNSVKNFFAECYAASSWLTITGWLMVFDTVISLLGLLLDPATVDGAPAWLKPLKFGISTSLFSFTVAYIVGQMRRTRRFASILARVLARVMAVALVLEIALIDLQAARHTSSHFNRTTLFDAGVFAVMGIVIGIVFLSTILLFVCGCAERFADRSLGWVVRLSLAIAIAAMGIGGLMVLPTPEQLAAAHATGKLTHSGAHTVGAPDGGAALPVTGWSADHGDLRIAHFVGLHAMQGLLLAWGLTAGRPFWSQKRRTRLVAIVAIEFVLAMGLVLSQALRGQPLLRPDAQTWIGWAAWLMVLVAGAASSWVFNDNSQSEGKKG
jgi:hypothetical protein